MMFTPCWPSAGPTGGAGLLSGGELQLDLPRNLLYLGSFGVLCEVLSWSFGHLALRSLLWVALRLRCCGLFHLHEVQLDRGRAAEIDTRTRTLPLSGLTSSTVPLKFENGPSMTRT